MVGCYHYLPRFVSYMFGPDQRSGRSDEQMDDTLMHKAELP